MPTIKPRTRGKHQTRHITQLEVENNETLFAYGAFIGEPTTYVLNQLIENVLARDKEFRTWREQHPGPHTPPPGTRRARTRSTAPPPGAPPAASPEPRVSDALSE